MRRPLFFLAVALSVAILYVLFTEYQLVSAF